MPRAAPVWSAPRSKRIEASERRPRALLVARTDPGANQALSKTMRVVSARTSESRPPITPPTAAARVASAMTSIDGASVRALLSSVVRASPGRAARTTMALPARRV